MGKHSFRSKSARLALPTKLKFGSDLSTEAEEPTPVETFYILTEAGDTLTTEASDEIIIES